MGQDTYLLDVSEARQRLLNRFPVLEIQEIPLENTVGRFLASDIRASFPLPSFDNSAVDGFALQAVDTENASPDRPAELRVVVDIPAGSFVNRTIQSGEAARIMTGAAIPSGANSVVPVENTDFNFRQAGLPAPKKISVYQSIRPGDNVRKAGDDLRAGDLVIPAGQRIRPQDAGLMSMLGNGNVRVRRKPKVGIFSSGDELLPANAMLSPGKIHDANMYSLVGLVEMSGAEALNLGIVRDQPEEVRGVLDQAVENQVDLILSSAGVSVGAMDFVRSIIEQEGSLEFWRVNMRPGKPMAFGYYQKVPFIGLPGNPVSAFVGFEVFVRPALLKMSGSNQLIRSSIPVRIIEDLISDGRESYLRAVVSNTASGLVARLTGHQGSGNLFSLVQANALLLIPSGVKSLPSGGQVDAWLLDGID